MFTPRSLRAGRSVPDPTAGRNVTAPSYGRPVELTPAQERALRELILPGAARPTPPEYAEGLRAHLVAMAAARLADGDREFAPYWRGLDELDRAEHVAAAAARLALFREAFPPLPRSWQPVGEQMLMARLGSGLTISGRPDLILGREHRLVLDLKTGVARPVHAEDMRFYALLATLVFRRAPYRVATLFL